MTFPTELQDRWQHTDPEIRLQALEDLESSADGTGRLSTEAQEILVQIASTDSDNRVRSAAAQKVTDVKLLDQLCHLIRQKDKVVYKLCKEKLNAIHQLEAQQQAAADRALQICRSLETLASKAIGPLTGAQYQYQLSQWQSAAGDAELQQRVDAASAILAEKVGQYVSDRTHQIVLQQSMEQLRAGLSSAEAAINALHAPVNDEQMQPLEQHLHELQSLIAAFPAPLSEASIADVAADSDSRELLKQCAAVIKLLSSYLLAWQQLQKSTDELNKLQAAVKKASVKDGKVLAELQKRADKAVAGINWPERLPTGAAHQQQKDIMTALAALQLKNEDWQKKILAGAKNDLAQLEQNIEQGHLSDAQKLWDKINNTSNKISNPGRMELQEQLQPCKVRIAELQGWKNFAATEKKKELIEKMQHVIDINQPPPQKAKTIRALQEDWKKLGHSDDSDTLWAQFNELAHKAFEPCKEYFKDRKDKMGANLKERNRICDELEQFIAAVTPEGLNIAETSRLEALAQEEWKKYAPVAQNKIKNLQKRFNNILNSLRQLKRKTLQHNADKKLELILRAEKLLELEDFQEAVTAAKTLQNEWKSIGPSPYKDDRNHWNTFRQACDRLFSKRDEQLKARKTEARKVVSGARDTLKNISALLNLDDEEFLQSKKQFVELKEIFYSQLNPDMKAERRQLIEQFEVVSKKYETRHRASPDRKSLQLINQVKARAEFCQSLESALLEQSTEAAVTQLEDLKTQWQELDTISDTELQQRMEKRFKLLCQNYADPGKLQKLSAENDTAARELCVEMEIQAGMDSPAQDKALRMKIQLNHLKHDFGHNRKVGKSKSQLITELELQLLCIGPLDPATRAALHLRTNSIKTRINS
jgi:DNA repair protein SbcC/Rad50